MGADGGLSFCRVKNETEALYLLGAIGIPTWYYGYSDAGDYAASAHKEWLDKNELPTDAQILEYGTSTHDRPSWDDISEIVKYAAEYWENYLWSGCTLSDIYTEIYTSPIKFNERHLYLAFEPSDGRFFYYLYMNWSYIPEELKSMPIREWSYSLDKSIMVKTMRCVETWT